MTARWNQVLCNILALGLWSGEGRAQSLELHRAVERTAVPGQVDLFPVALKAGTFVHVAVEQKGVDVVLSVVDPAGREIVSRDSPNGAFGFEHASAIAKETGTHSVNVAA